MTAAATVDVVIPVHDRAAMITAAVTSALAQTLPASRVIVVDDGSTDGTAEIVDRLADDHDTVSALHRPNGGPSAARNTGAAAATADLLAFADSDDLMEPGRLEWQVAHLRANPDVTGVCGLERIEVADGVEVPGWMAAFMAADTPMWSYPSLILPRDVFTELGGFAEDLRIGEDVDLVQRLFVSGHRVDFVEKPAVVRRIHGNNLSYENTSPMTVLLQLARRRVNEHHDDD